ncbi:MAG: hypothetical protein U9N03_05065 [Candidatus Caldatribacteriota bacterium]|nr:hypothetical protein [Candidatus Caldatribacteriota bacterium]
MKIRITDKVLLRRYRADPNFRDEVKRKLIRQGKAVLVEGIIPTSTSKKGNKLKVLPGLVEVPGRKDSNLKIEMNKIEDISEDKLIVWIQDMEKLGGAELSNKVVVDEGRKEGFNIVEMTPYNFSRELLRKAKLIILNNIWYFGVGQMESILECLFEDKIPYVKYEHDMRELSRLGFSLPLFKHAVMDVFISPMHLTKHLDKMEIPRSLVLPLAIDVDRWKPNKIKRIKNRVVNTCGKLHSKGLMNMKTFVDSHPDKEFVFYTSENKLVKQMFANNERVKLNKPVKNGYLPRSYNGAEYLVHLPDTFWAGERIVFEAVLCGCKVIMNENVGHASWDWDWEDEKFLRKELKQAPIKFWEEMRKVIRWS